MTFAGMQPAFPPTSASGAMLRQVCGPVLIGAMLAGIGTSTAVGMSDQTAIPSLNFVQQTTAGATVALVARAGSAIADLRRLSGFTWEQLARLFKVSRRSLHFWASGKAMTSSNEEHLQRLLAVVRKIDRGSVSTNRAVLLAVREDGTIPFDLLADEQYDRVVALIGQATTFRLSVAKISAEAAALRMPLPPAELVAALQDRAHSETGASRPAKSVKVRSDRRG